jgi:hypothetical protein
VTRRNQIIKMSQVIINNDASMKRRSVVDCKSPCEWTKFFPSKNKKDDEGEEGIARRRVLR